MWEIGERMGARLVFAEHRYEPLSHPALCGKNTQKCFAYCTTAQALGDWVTLIGSLRAEHPSARAPVVAFGGSYGGMLAGWLRMRYPEVVDGAIAASAPIWQLAGTVRRETLDLPAVSITRGVSAAGGATDRCRDNLRYAWPLITEAAKAADGLDVLSEGARSCAPLPSAEALLQWAQEPYFFLAEGNYPFPSTYITYSLQPGDPPPLPAWPMRVACARGLDADLGIQVRPAHGEAPAVDYELAMGELRVAVDWQRTTGNGANLTRAQLHAAGVGVLARAVADAAAVWYNLTHDKTCNEIGRAPVRGRSAGLARSAPADPPPTAGRTAAHATRVGGTAEWGKAGAAGTSPPVPGGNLCPSCPPCDDCPPCPVQYCNVSDTLECSFSAPVSKTFSWDAVCCNEQLSQVMIQGVGRDLYWPPQVPSRNYTVESVVGPRGLSAGGCEGEWSARGLRGAPVVTDRWSEWMQAYYGGRNVSIHRNIVWSNGALDPWSGQGVYPDGGGPDGPMVQALNADGSQIALILDLGAHHLDLMFSDKRNPPCFWQARRIEEERIRTWCQEAYDLHAPPRAPHDA